MSSYHLTLVSDLVCAPEMMLYNFTHSVAAAVRFANSLMPVNNKVIFLAASEHRWVPGCSMQEASRAGIIYNILENLQVGYDVTLNFPCIISTHAPNLLQTCAL